MKTVVTIKGAKAGKSEKAQWTFDTNQGNFKVWPFTYDDPNPVFEMLRHGIGDTFGINYSQKPWEPPDKPGTTYQIKTIEESWPATEEEIAEAQSTEANAMKTAGDASGSAVASAGAQHTGQQANAHSGASLTDIRHDNAAMIFVTGVVGRAMGSGQFGATEIDTLTQCALGAWHNIPEMEKRLRNYATDTDEFSRIHEREIKSEDPDDLPPVEAYENG